MITHYIEILVNVSCSQIALLGAGAIGCRNGFPPLWLMLFASSVSPEHACAAAVGSRP